MSDPPPDWHKPSPPEPKRVLPYDTPARNGPERDWDGRPMRRRLFGNVAGNIAMGGVTFVASCFLAYFVAAALALHSFWSVAIIPLLTLLLGLFAAAFPRYRGILLGMLLVLIGVPLLIIGLCALTWKGIR